VGRWRKTVGKSLLSLGLETASMGLPDEKPYAYVVGTIAEDTLSVAAYYTFMEMEKPGTIEHMFAAAALIKRVAEEGRLEATNKCDARIVVCTWEKIFTSGAFS
jgi:hypothetical protein